MGRRGLVEEQTTKVARMVKKSEDLTMAGIFHTSIIYHPTEGLILTGEEEMSRKVMELIERGGLKQSVTEAQLRAGNSLNHFSSRRTKENILSKLFNCVLPPLPMPLSEMRTLVLLTTAFGKLWEVELKGTRFKIGDPCPEKMKDWFKHGDDVWSCMKGTTHTKELLAILKSKGMNLPDFYRELLTAAYKARGADVQQFHLERDTDQLQSLLEAQEEGREERPEPEQQREDVDEQQRRVEQQRLMEAQRLADGQRKKAKTFELGLKKRMSVGDLLTMHKEAKTYNEKTIVQVVEKHYEDNGRLKSLSLSDGSNVSQSWKMSRI